jgi:hypothetical protein
MEKDAAAFCPFGGSPGTMGMSDIRKTVRKGKIRR